MYKYDERKIERLDNSMMHVDKDSFLLKLIKTPQQIYLLFQNKLELWVGFSFTDTHTKLPSTVIRQIMLSFCINHPINQALIY